MNDENLRFKELRLFFGLNQKEWGKALELEQGTISDIERCREGASISKHTKKLLYDKYSVNEEWLTSGTGKMITARKDVPNFTDKEIAQGWDKKYYALLEKYTALLEEVNKSK